MFSQSLSLLVVSVLSLLAHAAPQNTETPVISLPLPTDAGLPSGSGVPLSAAISAVNAHSAEFASLLGTSTFLSVQAELGLLSAEEAIGTATQLTAYITEINATPVVQVSSKGGQAITMATGTAGATTVFANATFVAVPNSGTVGAVVSKSLLVGAAAVVGSMAGAIVIL
ncbi:hypothetical protein L226DRAFT_607775 [Lentinus tigrinus ALCF2SS1-7]|uniref:Uncharacterized protein n=1 Tax=Lentinus tigrinus ALCF2SS1-6 TaxID=1328759 RepID=A0A5C2SNX5_9APHY|nr:hypothetical protein L227DRAFT_598249 [Lentinus tigrinus ALCF2SS1-6]RPD82690.1 hypothetical protein L226DRAFT_607775 [Lentinus tigrinus ALCF2SS1-7]